MKFARNTCQNYDLEFKLNISYIININIYKLIIQIKKRNVKLILSVSYMEFYIQEFSLDKYQVKKM